MQTQKFMQQILIHMELQSQALERQAQEISALKAIMTPVPSRPSGPRRKAITQAHHISPTLRTSAPFVMMTGHGVFVSGDDNHRDSPLAPRIGQDLQDAGVTPSKAGI